MTAVRKVLIADPDLEAARMLSKALRQRGYQVHYAADGSRALELAVLRHPDVVLFDEACSLIEPSLFAQILESNPRTEGIPVVVTGISPPKAGAAQDVFQKPFQLGEVLSRIEEILSRAHGAQLSEAQELEGSFAQLPLPDLLQMLKLNRRSGRLDVSRAGEQGAVVVAEGRPVDASLGTVLGEKALFRLLGWADGNFAFVPGPPPSVTRISRGMDDALFEGMRQADEMRRLEPLLPPLKARLVRVPGAKVFGDALTQGLLETLAEPHTLAELLDRESSPDVSVLESVLQLLRRGTLAVTEAEVRAEAGPLLGAAEVHALRAQMLRGGAASRVTVAKVLVCSETPERTRRYLAQLPNLGAGSEEAAALQSGFGTVARLELGENLRLDFCVLPPGEAARPLWRPFSASAVGVLVLDAEEETLALAAALAYQRRLPVVCALQEVPPLLAAAPLGASAAPAGAESALRALLVPHHGRAKSAGAEAPPGS
jgi:CheY-like chemotaxis protein